MVPPASDARKRMRMILRYRRRVRIKACILLRSCLTQQFCACADYRLAIFEAMGNFDCLLVRFTQFYVTPCVLVVWCGHENVILNAVTDDSCGGNDNRLALEICN